MHDRPGTSSPKAPEPTVIAGDPGASAPILSSRPATEIPADRALSELNRARGRALCEQEVTGSIPVGSIRRRRPRREVVHRSVGQTYLGESAGLGWDCHGHFPESSTSRAKLKNVRTATMMARTPTPEKVGATATVRMMSAATRNSSPRRMDLPTCWRYKRYANRALSRSCCARTYKPVATSSPTTTTITPAPSITFETVSTVFLKSASSKLGTLATLAVGEATLRQHGPTRHVVPGLPDVTVVTLRGRPGA